MTSKRTVGNVTLDQMLAELDATSSQDFYAPTDTIKSVNDWAASWGKSRATAGVKIREFAAAGLMKRHTAYHRDVTGRVLPLPVYEWVGKAKAI